MIRKAQRRKTIEAQILDGKEVTIRVNGQEEESQERLVG